MRLPIDTSWRLMLGALCLLLPNDSAAQSANARKGYRLIRDEAKRVVTVEYYGTAGLQTAGLHEFPHLDSVYITYGVKLTKEDVAYLAKLENLESLEMGFAGVSGEYVEVEGGLSKLAELKRLQRFCLCKHKMTDDDLRFVTSLPRITYLEFNADTNSPGEEGPTATDHCADYVIRAKTLREVCINGGYGFTDKFVSTLTRGLPDLEHLDLYSDKLTDESLRLLATRCKKLKWLDLSSKRFTDAGVRHLAQAKNLEMLWLDSNSLTSACVKFVSGLKRLEHLELTVPSIDDDGVRMLAGLRRLEILALRRPALTDKQFAMFRGHPTLESAFINGAKLTKSEAVKIIETIPNLSHLSVSNNRRLQDAVNQALTRKAKTK